MGKFAFSATTSYWFGFGCGSASTFFVRILAAAQEMKKMMMMMTTTTMMMMTTTTTMMMMMISGRDRRNFPKFTGTRIVYPPLKDKIAMKKMPKWWFPCHVVVSQKVWIINKQLFYLPVPNSWHGRHVAWRVNDNINTHDTPILAGFISMKYLQLQIVFPLYSSINLI